MEEVPTNFDVIILGTGLKEGIVSALLSVHGRKVLHLDRNDFYGGECASLRLSQLYARFGEDPASVPPEFGRDGEWSVDLIPKYMLSAGDLFRMLRHADCMHYLEFGRVAGSFVMKDGQIHRVPANFKQALESKLMGLMEKKRMANLLEYINGFEDPDPAARSEAQAKLPKEFVKAGKNPSNTTTNEFFEAFKLSASTKEFMGHAMALHLDDSYLNQPALATFRRIALYATSLSRFGQSPFIYPMYGMGDIPQAFARLAAVWGGVYMLNRSVDEILFNPDGRVAGVRSGDTRFYAPLLVGDPSYFPQMVQKVARVGRAICLLRGPVPDCARLSDQETDPNTGKPVTQTCAQIILPASQVPGRPSDIYVTTQGYNHRTTPQHMCLGYVSGLIYGNQPDNRLELKAGLDVLNTAGIAKLFYREQDVYYPVPGVEARGIFISKSYDETSHFETTVEDAIQMYQRITGERLDLDTKIQRPPIPGMENVEQ